MTEHAFARLSDYGMMPHMTWQNKLFKRLRYLFRESRALKTKHAVGFALDALQANGVKFLKTEYLHDYQVLLSVGDKHITTAVIRDGHYSNDLMKTFCEYVRRSGIDIEKMLFANVGANVGTTCLNAHSAGFRDIIAIEPESLNFHLLSANLSGLDGGQIALKQSAVGAKRERLPLSRHSENYGAHTLAGALESRRASQECSEIVEVATLDELLPSETDFILFADIEGYEPMMIKGAGDYIQKRCSALCIELTPSRYSPAEHSEVLNFFQNFATEFVLHPGAIPRPVAELAAVLDETNTGKVDIVAINRNAVSRGSVSV